MEKEVILLCSGFCVLSLLLGFVFFASSVKLYVTPSLLILFSPMLRAELTEKEVKSNVDGIAIKHVYRDDTKILEITSPTENAPAIYVNTTYTIIADNLPLYKYQVSKSEASFQRSTFADKKYTVKLHSTPGGTIETLFVFTANFRTTVEAFHFKDGRLLPFSDEELVKHRLNRNEAGAANPQYWNFFRVRGSSEIDVALLNYGQLLKVRGNGKLIGFEIAGKDRQFKPATATIGGQITEDSKLNVTWINLKSAQVKEPWYIRYAHGAYRSQANLANIRGDQALPFQTLPEMISD